VRKLTDSDKEEILKLYRQTAETTSTLAERYGVSNSTISRLLKSTLPEAEYEYLVSLKRAARTPEGRAQVSYDNPPLFLQQEKSEAEQKLQQQKVEEQAVTFAAAESPTLTNRRIRRRSSAKVEESTPSPSVGEQLELLPKKEEVTGISGPLVEERHPNNNAQVLAEILGEDLLDEGEDLEDLDEEDYDEEEDFEEEDFVEAPRLVTKARTGDSSVRVLPLSAANLPKTCYLVIDRASELITRPLRDFGDLGHIPSPETQERTLPVFDNHRVAKRFSTKRDRVIKIPDSRMLHKARYQLQAKGITRLLIDGQVYSLSSV
jgi:transposase-like protein